MGCNSSKNEKTSNILEKSTKKRIDSQKEADQLSLRSYHSDKTTKQNGGTTNPAYDSDEDLFQKTKIPVIVCSPRNQTKKYLMKLKSDTEQVNKPKRRRRSKAKKSKKLLELDPADDPSPRPPSSKKKEFLPDVSIFQQIDNYALKVPKSAEITVETLAEHLMKPLNSDLEKVRVFYRWMTNNISYDTDSVFKGKKKPVDPESVLRVKTSVSAGYANLFAQLCRYGKMRCKCIHGFAKGYGFTHDKPFNQSDSINHTWNAVYLDGDWRFIECTWGAGNIDSNKKFAWAYKEFYFLTDPEHLISSHFPYRNDNVGDNTSWQLLEKPLDLWTFNKAVKPNPRSFTWNVDFVSHKNAFMEVKGEASILIRGLDPYLVEVGSQLVEKDGTVLRKYSMVQKIDNQNTFQVLVRPPDHKIYVLKILGTTDPNDNEIHTLIEYTIKCVEIETNLKPFPAHFGAWGPVHNYLDYGFMDDIPKETLISESGELNLSLNTCKPIDAISRLIYVENNSVDLDNCTLLETGLEQIFVKVRMPKDGFYKLRISCKSKEGNYKQVINYLIDCRKPLKMCSSFPKVLKAARELRCRLLEPLSSQLPLNTEIRFRVQSSVLKKASLKRQLMEENMDEKTWHIDFMVAGINGEKIVLSGCDDSEGVLKNLYEFMIV